VALPAKPRTQNIPKGQSALCYWYQCTRGTTNTHLANPHQKPTQQSSKIPHSEATIKPTKPVNPKSKQVINSQFKGINQATAHIQPSSSHANYTIANQHRKARPSNRKQPHIETNKQNKQPLRQQWHTSISEKKVKTIGEGEHLASLAP
jgi:hypothetical protein